MTLSINSNTVIIKDLFKKTCSFRQFFEKFQVISLVTLHFIYKHRKGKTDISESNAAVYHKLNQYDVDDEELEDDIEDEIN